LALDKVTSPEQALIELYKKMKPGDPPTLEAAQAMLQNFFFKRERYSLSKVGRLKINEKLGLDDPLDNTVLTQEDILEEIVGEFTTDLAASNKEIHEQGDGIFLIDGSASIRDINRILSWDLDSSGAKTLNGLLTEILQSIPDFAVGIELDGYYAEIVQVKDNVIRTVKMWKSDSAPVA
jgi:hypothetical protein